MENKLKDLESELNQAVKNENCGIDEILDIANKIDKEIERVYFSNHN